MAKGRVRFDAPALKTWEDVDQALREVGLIEIQIEALEGDLNRRIAEMKDETARKAKPMMDRRDLLGHLLREFVEANKEGLAGKSRELNFGTVGLRRSTQVVIKKVKATIAALKARGLLECIKTTESIMKEELKKYDDATIEAVGAKRKTDEVFWYEIKREALKEV
ncbi:MAG: host-nuclease inhibitor protein Gam [Firmicutes bacterium]|nr:host-nuclease inhibitor protein Gam [Bacillota bacterium]